MRKNYVEDAVRLSAAITSYEAAHGPLPGIERDLARETFIDQIIDSEQRVLYFERLRSRGVSQLSADPGRDEFDPIKAAIVQAAAGNQDEAFWLLFLFVHFGKHRSAGWRYARDVYGRLGAGRWDWKSVSDDPTSFRFWLEANQDQLLAAPGPRGFGNHRKYESLNAWEDTGTGAAVESYVEWVTGAGGDHEVRFRDISGLSPEDGFDALYRTMAGVKRFGRIARFDYLTTAMKLGLLDIRPPHSYLIGATGPLIGARLLLDGGQSGSSALELQGRLSRFANSVGISADVVEDAVCNWQKMPEKYVRFSG